MTLLRSDEMFNSPLIGSLILLCVIGSGAHAQSKQDFSPHWQLSPHQSIFSPVYHGSSLFTPGPSVIESAPGGHVYVAAWAPDPSTGRFDIFVRRRDPDGSWRSGVKVSHEARTAVFGSQPRLAVSHDGTVVVGWPAGEGMLAWSTDLGVSFNGPVSVTRGVPGLDIDVVVDSRDTLHVIWKGVDALGTWDVYYTHSVGSFSGRLSDIDPGRFAPLLNLTTDRENHAELSLAADDAGRVHIAFSSALPSEPVRCEWIMLHDDHLDRYRLPEQTAAGQVDVTPLGFAAFVFSKRDENTFDLRPHLIRFLPGSSLFTDNAIPSRGTMTVAGYARSTAVQDDGTVAIAFNTCDQDCLNLFNELVVSRDFGLTFSLPLIVTIYRNSQGYLEGHPPALTLDESGTIHMTYEGPYLDGSPNHVIYLQARYRQ